MNLKDVDLMLRALLIYCDNTSTVAFSMNNNNGSRSRHIDIKVRFVMSL